MRVLVTGGAGFVGSNFVRHLLRNASEIEVINLDKLTYAGNADNLLDVSADSRYRFVLGDIADARIVDSILQAGVDSVVNLAAETHVDRSILDSAPFLHTNVLGTQVLLESARRHNIRRFIHVSSDEIYGSVQKGEFRGEDATLAPSSPYAASKAAGDHLVSAYARTYGLPCLILRPSNNYGPRQFPEKFIPLVIANALDGKPLPIYGDGLHERDWMHVEDFCAALLCALRMPEALGVYNISANNPMVNLNLAGEILRILGKPTSLVRHVADRLGHDRRYAMDSSSFRRDLGWEPKIPFEEGLRSTVKWYEANAQFLERTRTAEYCRFYERNYGHRIIVSHVKASRSAPED
ncbi:MAG TPA: dTDP-glucose 4,6-dehydratase [Dongiaceae bacterium]|nr:dTDP-glucose 4,6-dehydratase [Dongiaceae bacterium]